MSGSQLSPSHHKLRFYIVMITLVVGGILFLLVLNDNDKVSSLTSAITGGDESKSPTEKIKEDQIEVIKSSNKKIDMVLSFDQIPNIEREAQIKEMEIHFVDFTTTININEDVLELNNIENVKLKIEGFEGKTLLDNYGMSLDGKAKRIEVNDVAFSSKSEMEISFNNLDYQFLGIEELQLENFELPEGAGELTVGEKLWYKLDEDAVAFYGFNGQLIINKVNGTLLNIEGSVKGIHSGGKLDLSLQ